MTEPDVRHAEAVDEAVRRTLEEWGEVLERLADE
jgi:hypothetical protein